MMGLARPALARIRGIGFWKLCGAGSGEGFTPTARMAACALLATWPDEATARDRLGDAPILRAYRNRSGESWTIYLTPVSARGAWSGVAPFREEGRQTEGRQTECPQTEGPVAALTRATLRPRALRRFWRRAPAISDVIGADPNVLFKIGIGEVPILQQVTFSIWPDTAAMAAFARAEGPHARAIRAVREGGWFREELYARFRILGDEGSWQGRRPLDRPEAMP